MALPGSGLLTPIDRQPSRSRGDESMEQEFDTEKKACQRWPSRLENGRSVAQHRLANDLDRCKALPHQTIVEGLQIESRALFLHHVGAKFHDLKLAQRVVKISGVGGAALGLHQPDRMRLVTLFDEEVYRLVEAELAGVQLDAVD